MLTPIQFLIQSDFITQASREDVFRSTRNKALLHGVALAFRDAVLKLCEHPVLRYTWMRYLPSESISDDFWKSLRVDIIKMLKNTPCLRSWSETSLSRPSKLFWLLKIGRDEHGQPLFRDLPGNEAYLSRKYAVNDFDLLERIGVMRIKFDILVEKVQYDLLLDDSRVRTFGMDQEWQTLAAKLLTLMLMKGSEDVVSAVKRLKLIPLQDSRWVSSEYPNVYFPTTDHTEIPTDLDLNLVSASAVSNQYRRILFAYLGVKEVDPTKVIPLIYSRYEAFPCAVNLPQNVCHLRYIYWHYPMTKEILDQRIFLLDKKDKRVHPNGSLFRGGEHMYFEEEEDNYGPKQLFQPYHAAGSSPSTGLEVHFLNQAYVDAVPPEAISHGRSWRTWLAELAGVKTFPQLRDPGTTALSREFRYLVSWRSTELLGLLKRHWPLYEPELTPSLVDELKACRLVTRQGINEVQSTFLPVKTLETIVSELKVTTFPFLVLPEPLTAATEHDWFFLGRFGVKHDKDVHFYTECLKIIRQENKGSASEVLESVFKVYESIERSCISAEDGDFTR